MDSLKVSGSVGDRVGVLKPDYRASPWEPYHDLSPSLPPEPIPPRRINRPGWDTIGAAIEKVERERKTPWAKAYWERRLAVEGLGPVCEMCGGNGFVNRQAPKTGGAASYDKDGRLVLPCGYDAQPQPPKLSYAWGDSGEPRDIESNYNSCINRLIYGVNEVPCPRCHPHEKVPEPERPAKVRRRSAKREAVEKRNRELLAVLGDSK